MEEEEMAGACPIVGRSRNRSHGRLARVSKKERSRCRCPSTGVITPVRLGAMGLHKESHL
jgi:hypothetical protein